MLGLKSIHVSGSTFVKDIVAFYLNWGLTCNITFRIRIRFEWFADPVLKSEIWIKIFSSSPLNIYIYIFKHTPFQVFYYPSAWWLAIWTKNRSIVAWLLQTELFAPVPPWVPVMRTTNRELKLIVTVPGAMFTFVITRTMFHCGITMLYNYDDASTKMWA